MNFHGKTLIFYDTTRELVKTIVEIKINSTIVITERKGEGRRR